MSNFGRFTYYCTIESRPHLSEQRSIDESYEKNGAIYAIKIRLLQFFFLNIEKLRKFGSVFSRDLKLGRTRDSPARVQPSRAKLTGDGRD